MTTTTARPTPTDRQDARTPTDNRRWVADRPRPAAPRPLSLAFAPAPVPAAADREWDRIPGYF